MSIILKTEGYTVTFELTRFKNLHTSLDLTVIFALDPQLGNIEIKSIPMPITLRDLQDLTTYLEQHMANLQKDPNSEAYIFVPMDLQFQLQASLGEVRSPNDGEFTLQFMINVGRQKEGSPSVYVGGETVVTVENINSFISSIRQALKEIPG